MKKGSDKTIFNKMKGLFQSRSGEAYGRPLFVWKIVLVFFALVFALCIVFGINLFLHVQREDLYQNTDSTSLRIVGIKTDQLNNIVSYFTQKEAKFQMIISTPNAAVDPSL